MAKTGAIETERREGILTPMLKSCFLKYNRDNAGAKSVCRKIKSNMKSENGNLTTIFHLNQASAVADE
jgi:hypothetical protein